MKVPLKIKVNSDDNELEFQNIVLKSNVYKYTKSVTKLNSLIAWTDEELTKLIANNIIKEI